MPGAKLKIGCVQIPLNLSETLKHIMACINRLLKREALNIRRALTAYWHGGIMATGRRGLATARLHQTRGQATVRKHRIL